VSVAEQIAITDLISNGRVNVIFGAGYVPSEFAMFRKSLKDRAKLMDVGVETVLRALRGERFEIDGRPVFVRPRPVQDPNEIVLVGGGVPASAKRAARFDVGFGPMSAALVDIYLEECSKAGRAPRYYWRPQPGAPFSIHLSENLDEGWAAIEKHAVHVITEYAKWAEQEGDASNSPFKGLSDPAILRQTGLFAVMTPEQLLAKVPDMTDRTSFNFQPLLGGLSPAEGWKSLELLKRTMPKLKAAIAALK
jgi:alkanesulfonate monooxygenase SsuD/methylene tetrahydromethanopterin reductase-like flavin-dependent oxidoreductase (luciferase family)